MSPQPSALLIPCPACGKTVRVAAEAAGRRIRCPSCQRDVPVPAAAADQETLAPTAERGGPADDGPTVPPSSPSPGPPTRTAPSAVAGPDATLDQGGAGRELYEFLAPAQTPDELGRLGPYRVLKVLGAGGMGVVFKAEDPMLQRPVALKAMLPGMGARESAKQRFLREARSAAAIKHDHIVTIFQVGEDRGIPFLAMEFLDGEPLDERLKREPQLPLPEVLRIGREIAEGLAAAHERGLIHRDIKPANIWLEAPRARVKILDFGLARSATDDAHLTQSGAIIGTPAYMAPEQAQGKPVDHRSDLFSLGCVLYRLATGAMPFKGSDTISTLMAVATETPPLPQRLRPDLPRKLSDLVMKLLAKPPAERPGSARAVADALEALARESAAPRPMRPAPARAAKPAPTLTKQSAPTVERPRPAAVKRRRAPLLLFGGMAAAALVVVGLGGCLLAFFVLRPGPAEGRLALQSDDPTVRVRVLCAGTPLAMLDTGSNTEVKLPPGTYDLEIANPGKGAKLVHAQVKLESGKAEVARVIVDARASMLPAVRPAGFVPLFNGKDLQGWKTHSLQAHGWSVEDGLLTGRAAPGSTHLFTERGDFADFHVVAEVRVNDLGNSGIFFRCSYALPGGTYPDGYEAQILNRAPTPKAALTGSILTAKAHLVHVSSPIIDPDEWFTFEVIARGNELTTRVNGKTMATFVDLKATAVRGHIALQAMLPASTRVQFRKIEIKELSAAAAVGPAPFFNGRDLSGWEGLAGYWRVENGAIIGAPPAARPAHTFLVSDKSYEDFDLRFQVRLKDGVGTSGIQFRAHVTDWPKFVAAGPRCEIGPAGALYPPGSLLKGPPLKSFTFKAAAGVAKAYKDADFNEFHIRCVGKHTTIRVNGITAVDGDFPELPNEGVIAWQLHGKTPPREVTFRNIEFTDLSRSPDGAPTRLIFNGRDLSGWETVGTGGWWVEPGGVLRADGKGMGWLSTVKKYADFELELEYRLPPKGDSGIFLRAQKGGPRSGSDLIRLLLLDDAAHPNLPPAEGNGALYRLIAPNPAPNALAGTWNKVRVVAQGARYQVTFNGTRVIDAEVPRPERAGYIGLEGHPGTTTEFKNIRIRELPP